MHAAGASRTCFNPSPPRKSSFRTLNRQSCFRHCLAPHELVHLQPRHPLVPGNGQSARQGSACSSAGEEAPPAGRSLQRRKPSPCRPHGFVALVGEGTRRCVHAGRTGSSVQTARLPGSCNGGICRDEALLMSPCTAGQTKLSANSHMSAIHICAECAQGNPESRPMCHICRMCTRQPREPPHVCALHAESGEGLMGDPQSRRFCAMNAARVYRQRQRVVQRFATAISDISLVSMEKFFRYLFLSSAFFVISPGIFDVN